MMIKKIRKWIGLYWIYCQTCDPFPPIINIRKKKRNERER